MIATEYKNNTGKLLVAVLAMAMIIAGAAVVFSDSEMSVNAEVPTSDPFNMPATTPGYDYDSTTGEISITQDVEIVLTGNVGTASNPLDVYFVLDPEVTLTITGAYSVYIMNVTNAANQNAFVLSQSSITTSTSTEVAEVVLTGGVDAHFATQKNVDKTTNSSNSHVVNGVSVTLSGGSKLTMTQTGEYSSGVAYWNNHSPTLTIIENSELILDNAGGIGAKIIMDNGTISVTNPKAGAAYITLDAGSSIENSTISIPNTDGTNGTNTSTYGVQVQAAGETAATAETVISGSSISITNGGKINLESGANLDATGSEISAPALNVRVPWGTTATDAEANVVGGTFNVTSVTGDGTTSNTLTVSDATVRNVDSQGGATTASVENNMTIVVPETSESVTLNVNNSGKIIANSEVTGVIDNQTGASFTVMPGVSTDVTDSDGEAVTPVTSYNYLANIDAGVVSGNGENGGKWEYDATNNRLTLTDFKGYGFFQSNSDLNVVLVGTNQIVMTSEVIVATNYGNYAALRANGNLTITGSGSLSISSETLVIPEGTTIKTTSISGIFSTKALTIGSNTTADRSVTTVEVDNSIVRTGITSYDIIAGIETRAAMTVQNASVAGELVAASFQITNSNVIGDITATGEADVTGSSVVGDVAATTLTATGSEIVSNNIKVTTLNANESNSSDDTTEITVSDLVATTVKAYNANISADTLNNGNNATTLSYDASSTVIAGTLNATLEITHAGILIVEENMTLGITGGTNYYQGIPSTVANGFIYVMDGATVNPASGTTLTPILVTGDKLTGNIANTVAQANQMTGTVTIIANSPIDVSDLNDGTYVFTQNATGTIEGFEGTVTAPGASSLTVNGVGIVMSTQFTYTGTEYGVTIDGTDIEGTITLTDDPDNAEDGQTATFEEGATLANVNLIGNNGNAVIIQNATAGADLVIAAGSVVINGEIQLDGEDVEDSLIIVDGENSDATLKLGDAEITGTGTIAVHELIIEGDVTIGANVRILVESGSTLNVSEDAVLSGEGYVYINNGGVISAIGAVEVDVRTQSPSVTVSEEEEFISALEYYTTINVTGPLNFTSEAGYTTIDIVNKTINLTDNGSITVGDYVVMNFTGSTLNNKTAGAGLFLVNGSTLGIDDSDIYTVVDYDPEEVVINLANNVTDITGASTPLSSVGFGKVINFSNNYNMASETNLRIYGTVNVSEGYTLTIAANSGITIMSSGEMTVDGTLVVNGYLDVQGADVMTVNGTMSVTGTIGGTVSNYGTIDLNGKSGGQYTVNGVTNTVNRVTNTIGEATIDMYDGATLNVTAVEGALTVSGATDYQASTREETPRFYTADLTLTGVKGLTVTASESIVSAVLGNNASPAEITVALDIAGTVTAGDIDIVSSFVNAADDIPEVPLTITQTVDMAAGTTIDFGAGAYTIAGTLNLEYNGRTVPITNTGTITVEGEMSIVAETARALNSAVGSIGNINGAYYTQTVAASGETPASVTRTYTNLAAAVEAAPNADDDTVYIDGIVEIAAGQTVTVGAAVSIVNTVGNSIEVDGTLTFENFAESYGNQAGTIGADVMIDNSPARTYTSLAGAIESGQTDITLNRVVEITSDLTIPADVTVRGSSDTTGVHINAASEDATDDVTLTVEGALVLYQNSQGIMMTNDAVDDYEASAVVAGTDGYIYVPENDDGTVDITVDRVADYGYDIAGAHYYTDYRPDTNRSTTYPVYVISTVMHAADDSANVAIDNENDYSIVITGQITVDSLEFTAPEDATETSPLMITVEDNSEQSAILFNQIVLGQNVALTAMSGEMSGSVIMQDAEGNSISEVDMNRAVGVAVFVHTETDDAGVESDCMELSGFLVNGTVTISVGTVTVDVVGVINGTDDSDPANPIRYTGSLVVSNGATLFVPNGSSLGAGAEEGAALTVDGTLLVEGTVNLYGATINGTVTATDGGIVNVSAVEVNGTIDIVATEDDGTILNVLGILTVGSKPTELGTATGAGTINGPVDIQFGIIKAYPGADLSGAQIEVNPPTNESDANATVFDINGETYMTVYSADASNIYVWQVLALEEFELVGLNVGYNYIDTSADDPAYSESNTELYNIENWFSDASMAPNTALSERSVLIDGTIYAYAEPATVYGTVSVGVGLQLYIDDVPYGSSANFPLGVGQHTVRFEVEANYNGDDAVITFNGQTVQNGGTVTIEAGATSFSLTATGAVPATPGSGDITVNVPSQDDGMSLTDILLIVLVILIVIMAIIVALRLMRS